MEAAPPCPEEEASTELTFWTTNKKRKPEAEFPNLKHEKVTLDDHNTNKKVGLECGSLGAVGFSLTCCFALCTIHTV
ncbi:hypothetical protein ACFX10_038063 [Malus domestica]